MHTIKIESDGKTVFVELHKGSEVVDMWECDSPVKVAFKVRELTESYLIKGEYEHG